MKGKKGKYCDLEFISKLPNYSFISIVLRFTLVSIVGLISMQFIRFVVEPEEVTVTGPRIIDYFFVILAFNFLSEANIVLDKLYEKVWPIPEKLRIRIFMHAIVSLVLIVIVYQVITSLMPYQDVVDKKVFFVAIAMGLLFVNSISSRLIIFRFMDIWVYAQKRIDEMKQEKLKLDYSSLQDQLNPHFLFNNLSVLKSLIIYDQDAAVNFTQNFTDVYRYVLKSQNKILVSLKDELLFIESYLSLHKERLGDGLEVLFSIDKDIIEKTIAPLSLQLLVENAIKHNIVSKGSPLRIEIKNTGNYLSVKNNVQLKENSYSTKKGLSNLITRYELIGAPDILIDKNEKEFSVSIPVLEPENN